MTPQEYRIACRAIASDVYAQFRRLERSPVFLETLEELVGMAIEDALLDPEGMFPHEYLDDEHAKDVARHTDMDRKAFDRIPLSKRGGQESYHRMHHDCLALVSFSFLKTIIGRDIK